MRGSISLKSVGTVSLFRRGKDGGSLQRTRISCDGNPAISGEIAELGIIVPLGIGRVPLIAQAQVQG